MARKNEFRGLSGAVLLVGVLLCCCQGSFAAIGGGRVTFTISGNVGAPMVTLNGLPGNPKSDIQGFFSVVVPYGHKGIIRPHKVGWTFEPPSRSIKAMENNLTGQDFEATEIRYTIRGNVQKPGVKLIGLPGEPVSDAQGNYIATVPYGWNKTVTPQKDGYRFLPGNRKYSIVIADRTNDNYAPSEIQIEISGSTGQPGVTLTVTGLSDISTDALGNYAFSVKYGWSGTVKPTKEGCLFSPAEQPYDNIKEDQLRQDFVTEVIQFVVSGAVGAPGVEIKGLPTTVLTDDSGFFQSPVNYGWSGTLTPFKEGYVFKPSYKTIPRVLDQVSADFEAKMKTFKISGSTGVPNVQLEGFPGNPMTGPGGVYEVEVPYNWSGVVTPYRHGYTFTPESQTHQEVKRDKSRQIFKHEILTYRIAGTTGVPQVKLNFKPQAGSGKVITSNASGSYDTKVDFDWQGTITPEKEGYNFSPQMRPIANLSGDLLYESFTATLRKHKISGSIISNRGGAVVDATIFTEIGSDISAVTDENGKFELEVDYNWQGQLTPYKEGYTFKPINIKIAPITMNRSSLGFEGTVEMLEISGEIIIDDKPVEGVIMDAGPDIDRAVSDQTGRFSVKVPYDWSGEITPKKAGWYFDPPSETFANVRTDIRNGEPQIPVEQDQGQTPPPPVPDPATDGTPLVDVPPPLTDIEDTGPTIIKEIGPDANELATPVEPTTDTSNPELEALRAQVKALQEQMAGAGTLTAGSVGQEGAKLMPVFFEQEDMVMALQTLATDFGETIIPDAAVAGSVSCDLSSVTLEQALDVMLAGTGFTWKKTEFYYLVSSSSPTSPGFMEASETRRVKLSFVDATTAISLLSTGFQQYVQGQGRTSSGASLGTSTSTGGTYSSGFSLSGATAPRSVAGRIVIVTAPRPIVERIVADLKKIDKKPNHVFLDARVVVMEKGNLLNMGIEWQWPTVSAGTFRNPPLDLASTTTNVLGGEWPWSMAIGYSSSGAFTNALQMAINLMEENGEARVVANPQVMTQDGKLANFGVIMEEYYMMVPQVGDLGAFGFSRAELEKIESGTRLSITPYIGDSNDINLEVAVELSDSIPQARGTDLPVVTRRQTMNTVAVRDGGTVALAGLTQNRQTVRRKRTPGLSAIPILGGLFNNDYDDKSTSEVAVFVTARLVPEEAGNIAPAPRQAGAGPTGVFRPANASDTVIGPGYTPTGNFQEDLRQSLMESRANRRR